ncbi:unnamed protein product [Moneuplotes crassus]|uniref:Uncharacterized protein n=1 Tax=Euplotes crassus TaxID=5936 RepID=A0AAD1XZL3_EUPCR|nr:unnamed protein product [Moneuplotes crassus]
MNSLTRSANCAPFLDDYNGRISRNKPCLSGTKNNPSRYYTHGNKKLFKSVHSSSSKQNPSKSSKLLHLSASALQPQSLVHKYSLKKQVGTPKQQHCEDQLEVQDLVSCEEECQQ